MRTQGRLTPWAVLLGLALVVAPSPVAALELSGGVSLGRSWPAPFLTSR
jgi:hypothetical protein